MLVEWPRCWPFDSGFRTAERILRRARQFQHSIRGVDDMSRILCLILAVCMAWSLPADAASKKTKNAAAVGAGVGLVTGGASGAAKGAVIGGGAGAYANADKGDKAKKKAKQGAAVGAGVGLVTGGVSGAAKGAVYGGASGALYGEHKDKKK